MIFYSNFEVQIYFLPLFTYKNRKKNVLKLKLQNLFWENQSLPLLFQPLIDLQTKLTYYGLHLYTAKGLVKL